MNRFIKRDEQFYEFGPFCLNAGERVLLRDGRLVPLPPKALSTLLVLVRSMGHVVEKDVLMAEVWPDEVVEEGNLAQHVFTLRKALGETDESPTYIETIPRRGYRFVATVSGAHEEESGFNDNVSERSTHKKDTNAPLADMRSIAVLPFETLGAGTHDEYLGLGLADALINKLSNLKRMTVRPTSAVRNALKRDPVSAGSELKVATVLEGTIQKWDEYIRVTVQLVSVRDGSMLWAETFDEKFTGIFAIEDSISEQVATALAIKLTAEEQTQLTKRYTENTQSYKAYLRGRYFLEKRTQEGITRGIEYFEVAIRIDPNYALAYAGLADCYSMLGSYDVLPPKESVPKAKEAALKALSIEPKLAEAHTALGRAQMLDWDWQGAEKSLELAIELNPNDAAAHNYYAMHLRQMLRFDESLVESKKAEELDPTSAVRKSTTGGTRYFAGHYDQAIEDLCQALELDSDNDVAHCFLRRIYIQKAMYEEAIAECEKTVSLLGKSVELSAHLGHVYAVSGRKEAAEKVLAELAHLSVRGYVPYYDKALIHVGLDEKEQAFQCLEKAYQEHDMNLSILGIDPMLDALRGDPRFTNLLERTGLMAHLQGTASNLNGDGGAVVTVVALYNGDFVNAMASQADQKHRPINTEKPDAYQSYLGARNYWSKHTRDDLKQAIGCFWHAIELDPNYILAYAGIVDCYLRLATNYFPPSDALPQSAAAIRARETTDTLPTTKSSIEMRCDWDREIANRERRRADELKVHYPTVKQWRAAYLVALHFYNQTLMKTERALPSVTIASHNSRADLTLPRFKSSSLTPAEEVQILCVIAREQIDTGNYDAACAVLKRWWTMGEWPKLDELNSQVSADLLLTVGTLAGFVSSARQVPRGQKHAEALLNGAIGLFEQLGFRTLSAEGRIELALCYEREGIFDLARTTFLPALEALLSGDGEIRRYALIRLAKVECQAGRLQVALELLNEADNIVGPPSPLHSGDYHLILAATLHTLITPETSREDLDRALEHYLKAIDQWEAMGNHRYAALGANNHGYLLVTLGRLDEAETHLVRARKLFDAIDDKRRRAQVDDSLAHLHLAAGRFELAEQAAGQAVKTLETGGVGRIPR